MSKKRKKYGKSYKPSTVHDKLLVPLPVLQQKKKWRNILSKSWKGLSIIILLSGGITSYIAIKNDWFKSDKEKANEENTWQGDLKPPPITSNSINESTSSISEGYQLFFADTAPNFDFTPNNNLPKVRGIHVTDLNQITYIYVDIGSNIFYEPVEEFYKGIDVLKTGKINCTNCKLFIGLKDNRLYVSTKFKRLQNEELMGDIEYNHWKVYKKNALPYPLENDTMFEVRDWEDRIAFSIKYGDISFLKYPNGENLKGIPKGVIIRGYFLGDTSVAIISMHTFSDSAKYCIPKSMPDWKQKAGVLISEIKSIFE